MSNTIIKHLIEYMPIEIKIREDAFITRLKAFGGGALAEDYIKIMRLREALEIFKENPQAEVGVASAPATTNGHKKRDADNENFVLIDAIRNAIPAMGGKKFNSRMMYEHLHANMPQSVTTAKKASVSATLSNLVGRDLTKEITGQRKVWFRAIDASDGFED